MTDAVVTDPGYSQSEIMIAASARQLNDVSNCFVGVGLPNIVCNLAQRTVSPDLQLVYESGVFGARPERLPLSIGDPTLVTGAIAVTSMFELFAYYLQAGLIDVAFLGAAQIDRFGNINTTVIGDYAKPKVRLPGSGGGRARSRSTRGRSWSSCGREPGRSSTRSTSGPRRGIPGIRHTTPRAVGGAAARRAW